MTNLISDHLTDMQRWTGVFIFDVVLKDTTPRWWSTQAVTFDSGGGSHNYTGVIAAHSSLDVQGAGVYGVDQVMEIQFSLNNADLGLNAIILPANIQGGTIQPRFIYVNPVDGTTTTDAIVYPVFLFDLPSQTWPLVLVTAHNKWNFSRKSLPASTLGRHDRYLFPSTAAERTASGDPTSIFYPCGYDPDADPPRGVKTGGGGYYVGQAQGNPYEIVYDGTRNGTAGLAAAGLEIRWGGVGSVPPVLTATTGVGKFGWVFHYNAGNLAAGSTNPAKFGMRVPLAFGRVRIQGILLDTGGSPSGTNWGGARLSHYLLADGVNFADADGNYGCKVLDANAPEPEVYLTGEKQDKLYRVPNLQTDITTMGSFSIHVGTLGSQRYYGGILSNYRNISPSDDYPVPDFNGRDLYSGLCFIDVGIPKELAAPTSDIGPGLQVVFLGQIIETLDAGLSSVWQWSDNPIWIFIHCLKLLGWTWTDIDKTAARAAAVYCDTTLAGGQKRFRCNLYLDRAYKAADILRGIRNDCRMYTTYGADGQLELKIEATTYEEGGTKFAIDTTNILRGDDGVTLCKKFHKSIYETANSWTIRFQDEKNSYIDDARTRRNADHVNQSGEENDGSGLYPALGCPGFEQADRLLQWIDYKCTNLNEYYQVTCSQALIGAQVGQIGTITETRHGLSSQECRILTISPNLDGSIELVLQKHADAAYSDTAGITALKRAKSDSTYSPRSVANLTARELFFKDDLNPDVFIRKIGVNFSVPPVTYQGGFSSPTEISGVSVATSGGGGAIPGNQTLFVEVCPQISTVDGLAADWLQVTIPAGTNTNSFSFSLTLPAEADAYTVRIGTHPGKMYKHPASPVSHSGTTPFTVTIISIAGLDQTSLSPDPWFDHVHIFYYYDQHPGDIKDGGCTTGPTVGTFQFEPEAPAAGDAILTIVAVSADKTESDFFPFASAPTVNVVISEDIGNPSGASGLMVLTRDNDITIPADHIVFQFTRETTNANSINTISVWASPSPLGDGPYELERAGKVLESGSCTTQAGSKTVIVGLGRTPNSAFVGRVLAIFTDDEFPDTDLDGEIIITQDANGFTVNTPFFKTGTYTYAVLKRWWDLTTTDESSNTGSWDFAKDAMIKIGTTIWRTHPVACAPGTRYATLSCRNTFGVGTRLTAGPFTLTADLGVPDNIQVLGIANGNDSLLIGIARKNNKSIRQCEFRTKFFPALASGMETVDFRTIPEGGIYEWEDTSPWPGAAEIYGAPYCDQSGSTIQINDAGPGRRYFTFRFLNDFGWSNWSDGNVTPQFVKDFVDIEDSGLADTGPPSGWSLAINPGPQADTVIVTASQPATNRHRILEWHVQLKDKTSGTWRDLDADAGASEVLYNGSEINHDYNPSAWTLSKETSGWGDAAVGDLLLMDVRPLVWEVQHCQWYLITAISEDGLSLLGLNLLPNWAWDWDQSEEPWVHDTNRLRVKIVRPPWAWNSEGYWGDEVGHGYWSKSFIATGGDVNTKTFISDPISVPLGMGIADIQARCWFRNMYSTGDPDYSPGIMAYEGRCIALVDEAEIIIDCNLGYQFAVTLTDNRILGIPLNPDWDRPIVLIVRQDGVGGRTLTLNGIFKIGDTGPVVTQAIGVNKRDRYGFLYDPVAVAWDVVSFVGGY